MLCIISFRFDVIDPFGITRRQNKTEFLLKSLIL